MKNRLLIWIVVVMLVSALLLFASCSDEEEPAVSTVGDGAISTPASSDPSGEVQDGDAADDEGTISDGENGQTDDVTGEEGTQPDTQDESDVTTEDPEGTPNADDTQIPTEETPQTNEEEPKGDIGGETLPPNTDDTQTDAGEDPSRETPPADDGSGSDETPTGEGEDLDALRETDPVAYYQALEMRGEIRILDTNLFDLSSYRDGSFDCVNTQGIQGEYVIYVGAKRLGDLTIGANGSALLETEKGDVTISLRGAYNVAAEKVEIAGSDTVLFITHDTQSELRLSFAVVLGEDEYPLIFTEGMNVWQVEAAAQDVMASLDLLIVPQDGEEETGGETSGDKPQGTEEPSSEDTPKTEEDAETPPETGDGESVKPSDDTEETTNDGEVSNVPEGEPTGGEEGGEGSGDTQGQLPQDEEPTEQEGTTPSGDTPPGEGQEEQGNEPVSQDKGNEPSGEQPANNEEQNEQGGAFGGDQPIDPKEPAGEGNDPEETVDDPAEPVVGVPEESDCRDFLLSFGGKCALVETTSYHIDATYENYTVALFDMTRQEYKDMTRRLNRLENPEYADEDSMPTTLVVTGKVGAKHYSFTMHDGGETNGAYACIIDINGFLED